MTAEAWATAAMMLGATGVAVVTDLWKGKIYNWLTLPLLLAAPVWHFMSRGLPGLWFSLQGLGVVAILFAALCLIGGGKATKFGDLKLMAVVGALGGMHFVLWALLFMSLSGPLVALPVLLRRGVLLYTVRNFGLNMAARAAGDGSVDIGRNSLAKIRYSPCILIGVLAALYHPGLRW
jgi:prepilin signal peptidase PulO-like enzyme (type II secretory pathway)